MNKAVFMDRDDTVIHDPGYLSDPAGVKLLPGVDIAIKSLNAAGYKIVIVTNQSGIARGKLTLETLQEIHDELRDQLARKLARIDAIYSCPFHPQGTIAEFAIDSDLRKPKPGMLLKAAADLEIDLSASWMVGDGMRDVEAGVRAGCRTILIGLTPSAHDAFNEGETSPDITPDFRVRNLVEAARIILREEPRLAEPVAVTAVASAPAATPAPQPSPAGVPSAAKEPSPEPIPALADAPLLAALSTTPSSPDFVSAAPVSDVVAAAPVEAASFIEPELEAESLVEPAAPANAAPAEIDPPASSVVPVPLELEQSAPAEAPVEVAVPAAAEIVAPAPAAAIETESHDAPGQAPASAQEVLEEPMERQAAPENRDAEESAQTAEPKDCPGDVPAHYDEFPDVTERDVQMEILRELRKLSGTDKDERFSFTRMIATVAQGLALLTLVTAIANRIYSYTPAATLATDTIAWVMTALVLQVMAATFWIMKRN